MLAAVPSVLQTHVPRTPGHNQSANNNPDGGKTFTNHIMGHHSGGNNRDPKSNAKHMARQNRGTPRLGRNTVNSSDNCDPRNSKNKDNNSMQGMLTQTQFQMADNREAELGRCPDIAAELLARAKTKEKFITPLNRPLESFGERYPV